MLELEGVSVTLGGVRVLHEVSTHVAEGKWLGLVGPNGAGKTTLLRAVVGLVAHEGEIRVGGAARSLANRRAAARLIAYVPQRPVLPPAMTVTDYVLLGRSAHQSFLGGESAHDRRVAASVIERLDLSALARRALGQVSGGEAQRAVLARALAQEAPILAMDEPTASLDLGHGQRFLELADELRLERGLCLLASLHDLNLAAQYADEVLVLERGRAVATGAASAVLTEENVARYFGASVSVRHSERGLLISSTRPARSVAAEALPPVR
jgi:iron complex transport system ATP-binding protein